MDRYFRNVKYLSVSIRGISIVDTFWEEEGTYGECIIYQGLKPVFLLARITNISGNFIEEFDFYIKKYDLNTYKFLNKILKNKTVFSVTPKVKNGFCFYFRKTKEKTLYVLDYLDFDPIWYSLSKQEIERIIKSF